MIKFLKQKFNDVKYRRVLRRYFEPRKDFLEESRLLFIQKLKDHEIVTKKEFIRIPYIRVLKYALASILLISMLGGGSIILAEKQNVGPDSPLYEFKKLGESIQVQLAPEEERPLLHKEFAERRLEELKQLKVELQEKQQESVKDDQNQNRQETLNKHQAIINSLEKDFENEVGAILKKVEDLKESAVKVQQESKTEPEIKSGEIEKSKNLCQSISEIIERHREITPGNGEKWREFNEKCQRFFEQKNEENTDNDSENNSFWRNKNKG